MQNKLIDYNNEFEPDQTSYSASNSNYVVLNDTNNHSYNAGWIQWSQQSLAGSENSMMFDWSQGYVMIPWMNTLTLTDGTSSFGTYVNAAEATTRGVDEGYYHSPENAFASASKGSQHITDSIQCDFGGTNINRNTYFNNLPINESLKRFNKDQQFLLGDMMNVEMDSCESYKLSKTLGETNNSLLSSHTGNVKTGLGGSNFRNEGHYKRCYRGNSDTINNADSLFSMNHEDDVASGNNPKFTQSAMESSYNQGLVAMFSGVTPVVNNHSDTPITKLVFQYVSIIPLVYLHSFFKCLPSVARSEGFHLKLQMNIAKTNSWTVTYNKSTVVGKKMTPISIEANNSVGVTCPILLSEANSAVGNSVASASLGTGLLIHNGANDPVLVIRPIIGYQGSSVSLGPDKHPAPTSTCKIYVPQIMFSAEKARAIIENPVMDLTYDDFYVDVIKDQLSTGSINIERSIGVQMSKVRQFYIIPFLSATDTSPVVYNSPLSSAPTTCSFCKLDDFNVSIGGTSIFKENLKYNYEVYNQNTLTNLANINGNSFRSELMSGQITKSMWDRCYGVYSIDMLRGDEISDSALKTFQLKFKCQSKGKYDFVIIMTYQLNVAIHRLSGLVSA